jgi:CubicO group peptidase (beta-lactamase class C family)
MRELHSIRRSVLAVAVLAMAVLAAPPYLTAGQQAPQDRVMAAVGQIDRVVAETMDRTRIPGVAVAVVHRDQVVYLKGFGVRTAGTGELVDADTVFQLASVSKPIASTLVAALVGDGVVSWDDPIVTHDPEFAMLDPWVTQEVTLRDMFSHRSGLPHLAGDLLEDMGYSRAEVLHRLRFQRPDSSFRTAWAYTNFGLTEAAVAAARSAGRSWEDVSRERLYQPLGMSSTSSRYADFVSNPNRARGHVLDGGQWVARYARDPDAQSPAGGVSSSARDLTQWVRVQLGNGMIDGRPLIAPGPLRATHAPHIVSRAPRTSTERSSFYGLGWNVSYDEAGRVRLGHSGAFALGAGTSVLLVPEAQLGIVVLTNAAPTGAAEAIGTTFLDLAFTGAIQQNWLAVIGPAVAAAVLPDYGVGMDYSTPPQPRTRARELDWYLGGYANDFFGPIEVASQGEQLVLSYGPTGLRFPLTHWDGDVFLYQPVGENAGGPSRVTFAGSPETAAARVTIENLNTTGEGEFLRTRVGG